MKNDHELLFRRFSLCFNVVFRYIVKFSMLRKLNMWNSKFSKLIYSMEFILKFVEFFDDEIILNFVREKPNITFQINCKSKLASLHFFLKYNLRKFLGGLLKSSAIVSGSTTDSSESPFWWRSRFIFLLATLPWQIFIISD